MSRADWALFAGVVVAVFLVGGLLWGDPIEVLNTCSGGDCPPTRYIALDPVAGMVFAFVAAVVLVTIGLLRQRRGG